jgi:hypothetical protein
VAALLKQYPASEIFDRLDEVAADAGQARKTLSVFAGDALPPVWSKAQALGPDAVDALMLVALLFSHHALIRVMIDAEQRRGFSGQIARNQLQPVKAYTNLAQWIDQLGYATMHEVGGAVRFNLKRMFDMPGLGPLVAELLDLKLRQAGWDGRGSADREAARLGLHKVFGVTAAEFRKWLSTGAQPATAQSALTAKDEEFFEDQTEGARQGQFLFRPGHVPRDVTPLTLTGSRRSTAARLHNDIQNRLYKHLRSKLGAQAVGTENDTGSGTSVDLVTVHRGKTTFYEIKTGPSVRASIRQALPQLLEYAFWPQEERADALVIVSHLPATGAATRYIEHLRNKFGLPLAYRQFDLSTNRLR